MTIVRKVLLALLALLISAPALSQAPRAYTQPELDQMLAPVALYPDPLLSQVLMAATYPLDVIHAARWSRANPQLQGDDAVRAAQHEAWDPSVKSLLAFPQVLARMDESLDWTRRLGEAFLAQEAHVMETVQQLRRRAHAAGNLQSNEQIQVQQQGQVILVQPASPQIVYVPYYDPLVVYGPWWWPAYRPVYWAPWPRPYGVTVSLGFFFGNFDWHHRHVRVVHPTAYYYRPALPAHRAFADAPHRWRHEPQRRATFSARQEHRVASQPPPAPRQERRMDRPAVRMERTERRDARPSPPQTQPATPAVRAQAPARVPPEVRMQPPVRMPAAVAPQQPRAERQAPRPAHREMRPGPRHEQGARARERS